MKKYRSWINKMDVGTDKDILGAPSKFREVQKKGPGRPKVNKALVIKNLKAKNAIGGPRYTKAQIARMMKCTPRTINRIYNEAMKNGELKPEDFEKKAIGVVEADFESECFRARGLSFREWLGTKFKLETQAQSYFNFCARIWEKVWDKCDLVEFADMDSNLGDQMCLKFVTEFQDDKTRMRSRLKKIRFLIRFLRRRDLNDNHLTMNTSRHPRAKRKIPEISQSNFGILYTECEEIVRARLGNEAVNDLRLKIVTQMRTGDKKDEREFYGIRKGTKTKSYLNMVNVNEYQFHVYAKKAEEWDIIWMPKGVRESLFNRHEGLDKGDLVITTSKGKLLKAWGDATEKVLDTRLILHDTRKISLTWLYVMGVPLEVATQLNVGWKDLSTAHSHYIEIKKMLRKSYRAEYKANIPDWFKEGLEDFTGFEAVIEGRDSSALGAIQGTSHFTGAR